MAIWDFGMEHDADNWGIDVMELEADDRDDIRESTTERIIREWSENFITPDNDPDDWDRDIDWD